jgi:hypothetical protein
MLWLRGITKSMQITWSNFLVLAVHLILLMFLFYIPNFQCNSLFPTTGAEFGWRLNHVKLWYRVYIVCEYFYTLIVGVSSGCSSEDPMWVCARLRTTRKPPEIDLGLDVLQIIEELNFSASQENSGKRNSYAVFSYEKKN